MHITWIQGMRFDRPWKYVGRSFSRKDSYMCDCYASYRDGYSRKGVEGRDHTRSLIDRQLFEVNISIPNHISQSSNVELGGLDS